MQCFSKFENLLPSHQKRVNLTGLNFRKFTDTIFGVTFTCGSAENNVIYKEENYTYCDFKEKKP